MAKARQRRPSMYLVMLECTWDDAPLHLFACRKDAEAFVRNLPIGLAHDQMSRFLERDLTEPLQVSIIRFNASGCPKTHTIERSIEDEDTE